MAGVAGFQAGIKGVIGDRMGCRVGIFQVIHMAIHARHTFLVVRSVREIHAVFLVAVDAQCRDFIGRFPICAGHGHLLQGCAMRIVTGCAVHAALVVRAYRPVLPAEARIAVAASAQVGAAIDRHG